MPQLSWEKLLFGYFTSDPSAPGPSLPLACHATLHLPGAPATQPRRPARSATRAVTKPILGTGSRRCMRRGGAIDLDSTEFVHCCDGVRSHDPRYERDVKSRFIDLSDHADHASSA